MNTMNKKQVTTPMITDLLQLGVRRLLSALAGFTVLIERRAEPALPSGQLAR